MRNLFAAVLVLVGIGCSDKPVTPEGIIPPAKMKLVMYDMMRTGEFLSGYVIYKDTVTNKVGESMKYYSKVWDTHNITEAEFRRSYSWYQQNPEVMKSLMDSIMVIPTPAQPVMNADSSVAYRDSVKRVDSVRKRTLMLGRVPLDSNRRRSRK